MSNNYIYNLDIEVRDYELDSEGIVNNANYQHYLEYTRHHFCAWAGYSFAQMTEDGIIPVVSRIIIDYKTPLKSGDVADSKLWIERQGVRFVFHQAIFNKATGKLSCKAEVNIACIENGRLSRGEKLAKAFSKFI